MALDGRRLMGGHNNQPKVAVNGEGGVREETRPGWNVIVWGVEWRQATKKIKRWAGPWA